MATTASTRQSVDTRPSVARELCRMGAASAQPALTAGMDIDRGVAVSGDLPYMDVDDVEL